MVYQLLTDLTIAGILAYLLWKSVKAKTEHALIQYQIRKLQLQVAELQKAQGKGRYT